MPRTLQADAKGEDESPPPKGQLLLDATCVPANIKYPTDLNLLNDAREKTEELIDHLHARRTTPQPKPRTYRQNTRRAYLRVAKARKPGRKKLRQAIGKQLRYLRRNLGSIAALAHEGLLVTLPAKRYRQLLVIQKLSRQQIWMYTHRCHRIANRLVSLSQPHVRPIVRGKAGTPVEFGAKISVSLADGVSFVDRISWEAYNESMDVVQQIRPFVDALAMIPRQYMWTKSTAPVRIGATATVEGFVFRGPRWVAHGPSPRPPPSRYSMTNTKLLTMPSLASPLKVSLDKANVGLDWDA